MKRLFDWIEHYLAWFWNKAEDAAENDDRSLVLLRNLCDMSILSIFPHSFAWIAQIPQSLFFLPFFSPASLDITT
ncbi:MAG: hypothetical protein AAGG02_08135 [Cyanobacteria bacterium P01_H01_bin.15]